MAKANGAVIQARAYMVTLVLTLAATALFIATGAAVFSQIARSLSGAGLGPDRVLRSALVLNVALIILSWRRHKALGEELERLAAARQDAENRFSDLARRDPLSELHNRPGLEAIVSPWLAPDAPIRGNVTLIRVGISNFDHIRSFYGSIAGDWLQMEIAREISLLTPSRAELSRCGDGQFAVAVQSGSLEAAELDALAETMAAVVVRPRNFKGAVLSGTASAGIAESAAPSGSSTAAQIEELWHRAEVAMHEARRLGRKQALWFAPRMEDDMRFRSELEAGIRRGILAGEFVPYYEQQVDLRTGAIVGFEMLARWNSPVLGLVGPEVFIPVAEEIGAIAELSQGIIARALQDAKAWSADLTLAVNVSPVQLRDPQFAQTLLKIMVEANFPSQRLEIEITESYLHEDIAMVQALITSLKNQGVGLVLDDFGTGYNSLTRLRQLPFDRMKVDRSFVAKLADADGDEAVLDSITSLGRQLGISITIEGIESQEVLNRVLKYGDCRGQGYLFGRPQPAEGALNLVAARVQDNLATEPSVSLRAQG